jgi:hypothetical protein
LAKLGEDITETLEVVPRQWKVIQTVREKFTCRSCEKITQPPAPFHAIARARGQAGAMTKDRLDQPGKLTASTYLHNVVLHCGKAVSGAANVLVSPSKTSLSCYTVDRIKTGLWEGESELADQPVRVIGHKHGSGIAGRDQHRAGARFRRISGKKTHRIV